MSRHWRICERDIEYSRQFEYKKTDRLKLSIGKAVLDYFIKEDDLEFQAMMNQVESLT